MNVSLMAVEAGVAQIAGLLFERLGVDRLELRKTSSNYEMTFGPSSMSSTLVVVTKYDKLKRDPELQLKINKIHEIATEKGSPVLFWTERCRLDESGWQGQLQKM